MSENNVSKYETRKRIINYSKIGDRYSLAINVCHFCKNSITAGQ